MQKRLGKSDNFTRSNREKFNLFNLKNSLDKTFDRYFLTPLIKKQGRKRPLDTPKRMIERREREGKEREKELERKRERDRGRERERERERERDKERER